MNEDICYVLAHRVPVTSLNLVNLDPRILPNYIDGEVCKEMNWTPITLFLFVTTPLPEEAI